MTTKRMLGSVSSVVFFLALGVPMAGCAGEKQARPAAPLGPPARPMGQASMQPKPLPNTPTASNISISPEILRACNIPDSDAYFAFDSSNLTAFDQAPLNSVETCFTTGPLAGRSLKLVGHADPRGSADYNMTLGQARADAVSTYLVGHGLGRDRVTSTSRGAMDATGTDETGWAHDRRVDVMLAK